MSVFFGDALGQPPETPLAEPQQAELAQEILSGDRDRYERAVLVAQGLGASRMSDDVRIALITLLGQLSDVQDEGVRNGIVLENLVHGEFYLMLADIVADLHDARAISNLTRVGDHAFSRRAARGLAAFGEQALPAILEVVDRPGVSGAAVAYNVVALTAMVEDGGAQNLSPAARSEIVRVARNSLRSQHGATLLMGTELAVSLKDPELTEMVRALSQDSSALKARGVSQPTADLVRKHAADTLAKASARDPVQ
jgi:hypothetical protein